MPKNEITEDDLVELESAVKYMDDIVLLMSKVKEKIPWVTSTAKKFDINLETKTGKMKKLNQQVFLLYEELENMKVHYVGIYENNGGKYELPEYPEDVCDL